MLYRDGKGLLPARGSWASSRPRPATSSSSPSTRMPTARTRSSPSAGPPPASACWLAASSSSSRRSRPPGPARARCSASPRCPCPAGSRRRPGRRRRRAARPSSNGGRRHQGGQRQGGCCPGGLDALKADVPGPGAREPAGRLPRPGGAPHHHRQLRLEQLARLAEFPGPDAGIAVLRRQRPPPRAGGRGRRALELYLPGTVGGLEATVRTPDGRTEAVRTQNQDDASVVRWTDTDVSGVYSITIGQTRTSTSSPSTSRR